MSDEKTIDELFEEGYIPYQLQAEIWVWVLGIITKHDRLTMFLMWFRERSLRECQEAFESSYNWGRFLVHLNMEEYL